MISCLWCTSFSHLITTEEACTITSQTNVMVYVGMLVCMHNMMGDVICNYECSHNCTDVKIYVLMLGGMPGLG